MADLAMDRDVFVSAARVTVAFTVLLAGSLIYQGYSSLIFKFAALKKKERFERYNDPRMRIRDRIVGNLLEWSLPFLIPFWVSMILTNGSTLWLGWAYVAARATYPMVALNGGLGTIGAKTTILMSTVPAYIFLTWLLAATVPALM